MRSYSEQVGLHRRPRGISLAVLQMLQPQCSCHCGTLEEKKADGVLQWGKSSDVWPPVPPKQGDPCLAGLVPCRMASARVTKILCEDLEYRALIFGQLSLHWAKQRLLAPAAQLFLACLVLGVHDGATPVECHT